MFLLLLARALAQEPVAPVVFPPEVVPEDEVGGGEIRVDGGGALILEHTSMVAEVHAGLARVTLVQWFHNPYDRPIEAEYLLPLPELAAVDTLALTCGDRRIDGIVMPRDEARAAYDRAKEDGVKAALLEQQRDNLFTQKIAGICPDETVEITIQYVEAVPYDHGVYSLALPTTVGPRYAPPWDVPDADAIDTTYARTRNDLDLTVVIDEGNPLASVWSDSHDVDIDDAPRGGRIGLAAGDTIPNRDFVLSWSLAGDEPRPAVITHRPDPAADGYLALTIEPPAVDDGFRPRARELLFVLDASCSMGGEPWDLAKNTVLHALAGMLPTDTFDVVTFSNGDDALFASPQPATRANIAAATAWLDQAYDGGGTEMERGILRSLDLPADPERLRLVLFLTDGFIGDEGTMFRLVKEHRKEARLFSLGIGEAPNRYLLEGLAEMGKGAASYQRQGRPIRETVAEFYAKIAKPAMTDIRVDWGGAQVIETFPKVIPDLWIGQPLRVFARFRGQGPTAVTVSGTVGRARWSKSVGVVLPAKELEHEGLAAVWARKKIRDLEWCPGALAPDAVQAAIVDVAMRHHLVSRYTSLVAIDDRPSACGPASIALEVPHEAVAAMSSGLGAGGSGLGGGGSAWGTGGLGTRSSGWGASGYGKGGGSFSAKGPSSVRAVPADPIILGSLDRSAIDAVVKRSLNPITYCYERELRLNPTLSGRVESTLVIAADGSVATAKIRMSTLGNPTVEQCVIATLVRLQFDPPPGGGVVHVRYPFVFNPVTPPTPARSPGRSPAN